MPPVGFEPKISTGRRPQTYALDRAAIVTGIIANYLYVYIYIKLQDSVPPLHRLTLKYYAPKAFSSIKRAF
jgi:hypothetical protein